MIEARASAPDDRDAPAPEGYALCGWRVASELPLPELAPWADGEREPDLRIALGRVPAAIASPRLETHALQIGEEGARFHVKTVGGYLIEDGRRITIDPYIPVGSPDIRLFLFGTPFAIVCHQRGLVPMHASAVEVDGEAVVFSGSSGVGKSTLAAAFWRRGFPILSDDVTPIRVDGGRAVTLPGLRRIRLWRDSVQGLAMDGAEMERCRAELEKFTVQVDDGYVRGPLPVRALVHLQSIAQSAGGAAFRRLRGREAAQWLHHHIYRLHTLEGLTEPAERLSRLTRAAAAVPRHFVLARPLSYEDTDSLIDMIVATVRSR